MNTLCLVTSRLSLVGALFCFAAFCMTGHVIYLGALLVLVTLSMVFHVAYGNYRKDLRVLDDVADAIDSGHDTEVITNGLADLLEPDE